MFDGDHFHYQFIGSSRTSSSLSFPQTNFHSTFHGNPSFSATAFDPYPSPSLQESSNKKDNEVIKPLISTNLGLERETTSMDPAWSNDELLALLKLRSSMEICFPDFDWDHVSRKLAELAFKRSGEQCKEKFEEESNRHFNTTVTYNKTNYNNNFSDLDEFYPDADADIEKQNKEHDQNARKNENPSQEVNEETKKQVTKKRKKRSSSSSSHKFEMFKCFCEGIVKKMISQQEELHKKLIEDIVKRDEENMARDEATRNEEIVRVKREIEIREKEQASASQRQAIIIDFLKKFTSHDDDHNPTSIVSTHQNPSLFSSRNDNVKTPSSPPMSPSSNMGKRWPRDEVLALINMRRKLGAINGGDESIKEGSKGPLWERISQGMLELGYNRSAKRCKEKWENINKYFRKTKDSNKKRSIDSRTCPYFHQLSSLYNVSPTNVPEA